MDDILTNILRCILLTKIYLTVPPVIEYDNIV